MKEEKRVTALCGSLAMILRIARKIFETKASSEYEPAAKQIAIQNRYISMKFMPWEPDISIFKSLDAISQLLNSCTFFNTKVVEYGLTLLKSCVCIFINCLQG